MNLLKTKISINALGFILSHAITVILVVIGFTVDPLITIAGLAGLLAAGFFLAWKKK